MISRRYFIQWLVFSIVVLVTIPRLTTLHNNIYCSRVTQQTYER